MIEQIVNSELVALGQTSLIAKGYRLIPYHLECSKCDAKLDFYAWLSWANDKPIKLLDTFGWSVYDTGIMCSWCKPESKEE